MSQENTVPFDHDLDDYDTEFNEPEEQETLDDVRGKSALEKSKKIQPKGQKALTIFLLFAALLVSGLILAKVMSGSKDATEEKPQEAKSSFDMPEKRNFGEQFAEEEIGEYDPMAAAKETPIDEETGIENGRTDENTEGISGNVPEPVPEPYYPTTQQYTAPAEPVAPVEVEEPTPVEPVLSPEELRKQRIYGSAFNGGISNNRSTGGSDEDTDELPKKPQEQKPVVTPASISAKRMQNRDFVITKGNTIDCVLNTRFDSTVAGMLTCTVTRNIYGASGRVVLIDRGSKVTGEYKGGMQQGQKRVFIMWNRIETPKGVIINVNSPAAGALGEAGVGGRVDSKFWARFGGAMLVSIVNDFGKAVSEAAAEKTFGNGIDVNLEESSDTAREMATAELEKSINIPPSLIKHQGDRVSIFVADDMYFGDVYALRPR